jgi:hypothetical protein
MKNAMCCGLAVLALSASAGAQAHKMDSMKSEMTYTGGLELSPDGKVTLRHAMAAKGAAKTSASKDAMAHDSMTEDSMAPTITLSSASVDLAKHVGHKVTIKGVIGDTMNNTAVFTVKSMKMVASSCK